MSEHENPDVLEETSADYLISMWYSGTTIYGVHLGWFALAATLIIAYFWPQIQSKLDRNYKERQEKAYEAKCKKNPDWVQSRQQAMEAARLRMQDELSRKAKEHSEKVKEREEQKRQERLDSLDKEAGGHTLGGSTSNATTNNNKKGKNSFKPEYHPLMGSGPSTTYRPPRRSCCPSSGGCG